MDQQDPSSSSSNTQAAGSGSAEQSGAISRLIAADLRRVAAAKNAQAAALRKHISTLVAHGSHPATFHVTGVSDALLEARQALAYKADACDREAASYEAMAADLEAMHNASGSEVPA